MKAVAYLRVSTAGQQEAFGPEVQRTAIQRWAKANNHRVVSWQTDTISGTSELAERAGWVAAQALVKDGKAGGIVVARLDRLARDVLVQELLLRDTHRLGGVVMSARESENEQLSGESKDPSRKLIRTILGAIREYDREMISDRLESARKAKAAAGGYAHGALPYGLRSEGGELVPHDAEQTALERMESLAARGISTRKIAEILTAEGHPTKRGGKWSSATVSRILSPDNKERETEQEIGTVMYGVWQTGALFWRGQKPWAVSESLSGLEHWATTNIQHDGRKLFFFVKSVGANQHWSDEKLICVGHLYDGQGIVMRRKNPEVYVAIRKRKIANDCPDLTADDRARVTINIDTPIRILPTQQD